MKKVFSKKSLFIIFSSVPLWAEPHLIRIIAHALSGRRFDADFVEWFLPQYLRGRGKANFTEIAVSSAEFLFDLFTEVWMTLGQTAKIPRGNRKYQVCINGFLKGNLAISLYSRSHDH